MAAAVVMMTASASAEVVYEQGFDDSVYDIFGSTFNYTQSTTNSSYNLLNSTGDAVYTDKADGLKINDVPMRYLNKGGATDSSTHDEIGWLTIEPKKTVEEDGSITESETDNQGVLIKTGNRQWNKIIGFKKDLSEEIAAMNKADYEAANGGTEDVTPADDAAEEEMTFPSVITSGVYNVDYTVTTTERIWPTWVFRNGTTDVLTITLNTEYTNDLRIGKSSTTLIGANSSAWWTKAKAMNLRFVLDFDNNTIALQRKGVNEANWYTVNKDVEVTATDSETGETTTTKTNIKEFNLSDYGVNLKEGIDTIAYRVQAYTGAMKAFFDNISVTRVSDGKPVFACTFDDPDKDSWADYGFKADDNGKTVPLLWIEDSKLHAMYSKVGTAAMESGDAPSVNMRKKLDSVANSGIWAVSFTAVATKTNDEGATVAGSLSNIVQANNDLAGTVITLTNSGANDENHVFGSSAYRALGVAPKGNNYGHAIAVSYINGTKIDTPFNVDMRRADGQTMVVPVHTGAKYKLVINFDTDKVYCYTNGNYNHGGMVLINPEGYELPEDFAFDGILIEQSFARTGTNVAAEYVSWDDIKIEKLDSAADMESLTMVNGYDAKEAPYVSTGDAIVKEITMYHEPDEASKTTYIHEVPVKVFAAAYDKTTGKLVEVKMANDKFLTAFDTVNAEFAFETTASDLDVKIFSFDGNSYAPITGATNLEWVSAN